MTEAKQIRNPVKAIGAHCLKWCCCGNRVEMENCTSPDCALYPFRFGKNPFRTAVTREYTEEERRAIQDRMKTLREMKKAKVEKSSDK